MREGDGSSCDSMVTWVERSGPGGRVVSTGSEVGLGKERKEEGQ